MFTVVGLLGMTGIIINDSIVLVTTIDQYAEDRGLIPSIIDGTADRLRPVMLTTLTTVLGMAPLLYEQSAQAQFLKPTVITLVYGLGFGMVLVLLIVPALVAMQHDVSRQIGAMRRGLRARATGLRLCLGCLSMGVVGWLGMTMGVVIWTGSLWQPLVNALPMLSGGAPLVAALGMFILGVMVLCLFAYIVGAFAFALRKRKIA